VAAKPKATIAMLTPVASIEPTSKHWHGRLNLHYTHDGQRTVAHHEHDGPLRVLKALYPEGDAVCHHVLVHPPSGMVGGDALTINVTAAPQAHALITTPGATRFYRSLGPMASQSVTLVLAEEARLEWLPLETIVYPQARASNRVHMSLGSGASMIGWDVVCLGLPASGAPFAQPCTPGDHQPTKPHSGVLEQHLEVQGAWLEHAMLRASDTRLLQSPLGLGGRTVMATAWVTWGAWDDALQGQHGDASRLGQALVDEARDMLGSLTSDSATTCIAAITQVQRNVVVLRAVAHEVQDVWPLLRQVRGTWRRTLWSAQPNEPRVWGFGGVRSCLLPREATSKN
jgi:urease accessory protein